MTDEEIRVAALNAAIAWFVDCCDKNTSTQARMPRQTIVETASRFEEYIRSGT